MLKRESGKFEDFLWEDIVVGDVVKILDGHQFPSDIILISSSYADGHCSITTANLDGYVLECTRIAQYIYLFSHFLSFSLPFSPSLSLSPSLPISLSLSMFLSLFSFFVCILPSSVPMHSL